MGCDDPVWVAPWETCCRFCCPPAFCNARHYGAGGMFRVEEEESDYEDEDDEDEDVDEDEEEEEGEDGVNGPPQKRKRVE